MLQTKFKAPSLFNPSSQSPEEIVATFVIRLNEFNELSTAIKHDTMATPPQHFLIQGQRGYGKTTLLLRLNLEIKNDAALSSWLIPILFNEEQYSVRTLAKLWEEVVDVLENEHEGFSGLSDGVEELYDKNSPEEEVFKLLVRTLNEHNKKLVLLLDNFNDMIEKFSTKESQRLREVLSTCNSIRLIGTSSAVLEFYHNYKEPFFDFFKVIPLEELDSQETILLLQNLGETYKAEEIKHVIEKQPERIEALRRLAGGVPRTIVLLFEIFVDNVDGSSFRDLEAVLDRVTPLYKHRLDNLSTQQQAIIDAIAQNWDAISTKEIAKQIRMQSKAVASQLNQLEKAQLIRKIPTSTKNNLYQISERFFNIYYLMRLGKRKNRNKVLWLVRFLEIWCGESELRQRARKHIEAVRAGVLDERHAFYFSQALANTTDLPVDVQHELITETRGYLNQKGSEYANEVSKSHVEVQLEVTEDLKQGRDSSARRKLRDDGVPNELIEFELGNVARRSADFAKAEQYYLMAVEKGHAGAMNNLAVLHQKETKDFTKAEQYYLMAVEKRDAGAMNNLALLYETEMKDSTKAEQYYLMAVEKGDADAMFNLALLYETEMKDFAKAERYYLMAFAEGNVRAICVLALMYRDEIRNFRKAEQYLLKAIDMGYTEAAFFLGSLYETEMKDLNKAEQYYLMAVSKGDVDAMFFLASLYWFKMHDLNKAEQYYLMAVSKGDVDAMSSLGSLYETEMKDFKKAEQYYLMGVSKGDDRAKKNLAAMYFSSKAQKTQALELQKESRRLAPDAESATGLVQTLLWNNEIEEAINVYRDNFDNEEIQKEVGGSIDDILLMFLAKKQHNFVYKLFEENKFDIRDKYKAIYYALISLMGEEYADELKKMGPELQETVTEILKEVERLAVEYA